MDAITQDDLFAVARAEALARNGLLTVSAVDREGSDANILLASGAAVGDECIAQLTIVEAGLFLDSAEGTALDRLVFDRYGLTRKPAAPAVGVVSFLLTTANPTPFTIPAGTMLTTTGGVQFITLAAALFSAGLTSISDVPVQSVLAGADQQASQNSITSIGSQIPGSPNGLAVTNPLATAGAGDAEDDPSLRGRARNFFSTARRGTMGAIINGALAVPGVKTAQAFESLDTFGHPARLVQLVVTDQYTAALANLSPTPPAYQAQAQTFASQVFNGLVEVRAAGIYVQVVVGSVVMQAFTIAPNIVAGADADAVTAQAVAGVVNYTNALASGATWARAAIVQLFRGISGLANPDGCLLSPPNDIVPTGDLVAIRTDPGLVTVA